MPAYYNEIDSKAAAWLRELIKQGHIAPGEVDERSIEDVKPSELMGFTQCHFFAGIGVWSYALRQAGWSDDQPVWTGSCPCQPFSAAGKGKGIADERHLWPALYHLIRQCKPDVVFGEQVASKDGLGWLDIVQTDLEGAGYAVGASDICAAGFGAPHIRQRLYWVADAKSAGEQRELGIPASTGSEGHKGFKEPRQLGSTRSLADSEGDRRGEGQSDGGGCSSGNGTQGTTGRTAQFGESNCLADANDSGLQGRDIGRNSARKNSFGTSGLECQGMPGPVNGFWRDADWLLCRDGKWRAVEPGTFPLVNGAPARVGRLRGYGNAIVAQVAQAFIEAYLDLEV